MWSRNSGLKNNKQKKKNQQQKPEKKQGIEQEELKHHYPLNGKQGTPVALLCQRSQAPQNAKPCFRNDPPELVDLETVSFQEAGSPESLAPEILIKGMEETHPFDP